MRTLQIFRHAAHILPAGLLLLGSCSQDNTLTGDGDTAVRFTAGIEALTYTANGGNNWALNDPVGIFMLTASGSLTTPTHRLADNAEYSVTNTTTGALSGTPPLYYPQTGNVDFIAYYPHGTVNTPLYTYTVSVNDQTDPAKIDVLYSRNAAGKAKSQTAVNLVFDHMLSKITLNIKLGNGLTALSPNDITAVEFSGMPHTATLALQDGALTPGATGTFAAKQTATATFSAILVPQPEGHGLTNRTAVITANGKNYTWTIPDAMPFNKGHHYTCEVTLKLNGIAVGTPTIAQWDENDHPVGEVKMPPAGMALIPAGTFLMGNPDPNRWLETQHWVTLTQDFWMSKYEITNAQFAEFLNATGVDNDGRGSVSYFDENGLPQTDEQVFIYANPDVGLFWDDNKWVPVSGYYNYPATRVEWYGAKAYTEWVSQTTGTDCRLPTEAQWEYACRAGTTTAFYFGDDVNNLNDYGWSWENNTTGGYPSGPKPVGLKKPNPYGLYDMHGNVHEWCADWYAPYPDYAVTDPDVQRSSLIDILEGRRVLRGSHWRNPDFACHSAYRDGQTPFFPVYLQAPFIGFRVVVIP
jgi:formylglycine-generating enzyme required for sulfatase activity